MYILPKIATQLTKMYQKWQTNQKNGTYFQNKRKITKKYGKFTKLRQFIHNLLQPSYLPKFN